MGCLFSLQFSQVMSAPCQFFVVRKHGDDQLLPLDLKKTLAEQGLESGSVIAVHFQPGHDYDVQSNSREGTRGAAVSSDVPSPDRSTGKEDRKPGELTRASPAAMVCDKAQAYHKPGLGF